MSLLLLFASAAVAQTLSAGTPVVTITAPAVTLVATRTLSLGAPSVTFSAPAVTVQQTGPQTVQAGTPVVTFSAPGATRIATRFLQPGTPTLVLSAPLALVMVGGIAIQTGAPLVTLTAPIATVQQGSPPAAGDELNPASFHTPHPTWYWLRKGIVKMLVYNQALAITPHDTTNIGVTAVLGLTHAIYVGGAGIVAVVFEDGSVANFTAVAGEILPLRAKRVNSTNTTATLLVALWMR